MVDGRLTAPSVGDYPSIRQGSHSIKVSATVGDVEPGSCVEVFPTPLRICVGKELDGKRLGIQYSLYAQNLKAPAKGKLRLLFHDRSLAAV